MCPISTSHELFEKYLEKQSENIHWTYLDFKEGFDSVNRDSAWQLYNKMCLPTTFVDLLRVSLLCYAIKLLIKTYRILSPSLMQCFTPRWILLDWFGILHTYVCTCTTCIHTWWWLMHCRMSVRKKIGCFQGRHDTTLSAGCLIGQVTLALWRFLCIYVMCKDKPLLKLDCIPQSGQTFCSSLGGTSLFWLGLIDSWRPSPWGWMGNGDLSLTLWNWSWTCHECKEDTITWEESTTYRAWNPKLRVKLIQCMSPLTFLFQNL